MKFRLPSILTREDVALLRFYERTYGRPWRGYQLAMAACMVVSSMAMSGLIIMIQPAVDGTPGGWLAAIGVPTAIVGLVTINGIALYLQTVLREVVTQGVTKDLVVDLARSLIASDLAQWTKTSVAAQATHCIVYPNAIVSIITGMIIAVARDVLMCVALIITMFSRDWLLASCAMLIVPLFAVGIRQINDRIKTRTQTALDLQSAVGAQVRQSVLGLRTIKLHGAENREATRFNEVAQENRRVSIRLWRIRAAQVPLNEFITGVALAGAIVIGAWRVESNGTSMGALATFVGAMLASFQPLKRLSQLFAYLPDGLTAARAARRILDARPEIHDRADAGPLAVSGGTIRFDDVGFAYEKDRPAVEHVSFTASRGRVTALVGPSGGGKSTLLSLIPRLYDVQSGAITIDGQDIRDVTLASLRGAVAVVTQDTILFDDTIRANIAYGRPGADDAAIEQAARAAGAHDFIVALPEGYATRMGERGVLLSGGQRQRIGIARAWLKDAPILLLDEPTSALDAASEAAIKESLRGLMRARTTILVTHRLSAFTDADIIHVVGEGRIMESGTHGELLRHQGIYAKLLLADAA